MKYLDYFSSQKTWFAFLTCAPGHKHKVHAFFPSCIKHQLSLITSLRGLVHFWERGKKRKRKIERDIKSSAIFSNQQQPFLNYVPQISKAFLIGSTQETSLGISLKIFIWAFKKKKHTNSIKNQGAFFFFPF